MPTMLTWTDDHRFLLGDTTFLTMPPDAFNTAERLREGEFLLFKPRAEVERYVALLAELEPQHIFELGIFQGGSTLFFAELARPRRIVAIDIDSLEKPRARVGDYAAASGLADMVRTYGEVDQADRRNWLRSARRRSRGSRSTWSSTTVRICTSRRKASFNELFPRLRPGGAYVIEDWSWAHIHAAPSTPRASTRAKSR